MVAKTGTDAGVKWRLAPALVRLVAQLDRAVPHRDRVSDGSIASHQHHLTNPRSDHEPHHFQDGEFVTAVDVTHNAEEGVDCHLLWDALLRSKDPRIKYVIFARQIFNDPRFVTHTTGARKRGAWHPGYYDGSSPHTHHLHISIWGDGATDTGDWNLGDLTPAPRLNRRRLRRRWSKCSAKAQTPTPSSTTCGSTGTWPSGPE